MVTPGIHELTTGLEHRDGIYYSRTASAVSYPEEQRDVYFQIEDESYWFHHRNKCIIEALNHHPPQGAFFDIGGGNGYVSRAIEEAGFDTVLIESSPVAISHAHQRNLKQLICSTFNDAGFNDRCLPAVGLFDVLEHVREDMQFLQDIRLKMIPGGLLYITVPAYSSLWSEEDVRAGHIRRYTRGALLRRLVNAGFSPLYSTQFFTVLPIPIFLFRSIPAYLGLNSRGGSARTLRQNHSEGSPPLGTILNRIWNWELKQIRHRRSIRIGSSCLAIARRND